MSTNHQIKHLEYNYDLLSGKVNKVGYQPGELDQSYHKYSYDADNRLQEVRTSRDNIFWDLDAKYFYYGKQINIADKAVGAGAAVIQENLPSKDKK